MNRGGFSWKRFFGISAFKAKISRTDWYSPYQICKDKER